MLEKNKNYVEMCVSSTDYAFTQNESISICIDGYVYTSYMNLPDPGELYILISKEKFEALQKENEQLKKKLGEFDFMGWMESAKLWKGRYNDLFKLVGFSSTEEIRDYLTDTNCDTLQEAILKLTNENKYACEKWCNANSSNNSWKAAAECNSPKDLIEKREARKKEIEIYSRALQEWKEETGCPSPSAVKTMIESLASWHHAYHEVKGNNQKLANSIQKWKDMTKCETPEAAATWITSYESACERGNRLAESVDKLKEEVVSWKNVTGCATPEDYLAARISDAFHTPFDYTAAWQAVTGCSCPEDLSKKIVEWEKILTPHMSARDLCSAMSNAIESYKRSIEKWQEFTGRDTPEEAGCKINDLCDDICKLKGDYDRLLKLTGYKSEQDIRATLTYSKQFVYETIRELINSLERKAKFTDSNWETATGFSTPEKCCSCIDRLEKKLEDIKNLTEED